ncbi:MAG: cupredoxin domain-containing protein [Actinomycetota bacterium]
MRKHWLLIGSVSVALVAGACGGGDGGAAAAEDGGTVTVTALDNEFDPASVSATTGATIEVINDGEAAHNFSIKGQSIDVDVQPGESAEVQLADIAEGSYDVLCKFHEKAGMTGTLEIE